MLIINSIVCLIFQSWVYHMPASNSTACVEAALTEYEQYLNALSGSVDDPSLSRKDCHATDQRYYSYA